MLVNSLSISLFKGENAAESATIDQEFTGSLAEIANKICSQNWSPSIYRNKSRKKENFRRTELLALDVDEGCSLERAKDLFKDYSHVIATTKSHRKTKASSAVSCDRFRVLITLSKPVTSEAEYNFVWGNAYKMWPFVDRAAKDTARFYFKSQEVVICQSEGKPFPVELNVIKGTLKTRTLEFMSGKIRETWHKELILASWDLRACKYSVDEAIKKLELAAADHDGSLNDSDKYQIKNIYQSKDDNPPFQIKFPSREEVLHATLLDRNRRLEANESQISFLNKAFDPYFRLKMGLVLIGAKSGGGKSTTVAGIIAQYIRSTPADVTKALVISNEESSEDVLSRIVCILNSISWGRYRNDVLTNDEMKAFKETFEKVLDRVIVIPQDYGGLSMTKMEDIIEVLEEVKKSERYLSMVLIDYLQTINESSEGLEPWQISKNLGFYLKKYGIQSRIPVVLFVQLNPGSDQEFSQRVQNDRTIYNHAVAVIEAIPDVENCSTRFMFWKDRHNGFQGKNVTLSFKEGRFLSKEDKENEEV